MFSTCLSVTRFRGMISTQPGSTPLASFKIVTIDASDANSSYAAGNDIGINKTK